MFNNIIKINVKIKFIRNLRNNYKLRSYTSNFIYYGLISVERDYNASLKVFIYSYFLLVHIHRTVLC